MSLLTFAFASFSDRIIRLLGQGTFGKVVEAKEAFTGRKVAIKIIRAVQKYRDAAAIEIRVLNTLKANDPANHLWVTNFSHRSLVRNANRLAFSQQMHSLDRNI